MRKLRLLNLNPWSQVVIVLFFALCASSAVVAEKITSDHDKATDFSRFGSYAWVAGQAVPAAHLDLYIRMAIDDDFAKKGLHKVVEPKDADLLVTYNAARDTDLNISSFHDPTYAATGGEPMVGTTMWSSGSTSGSVGHFITKGTLAIVIYDRQQHKVIWEAAAKGTVKERQTEKLNQLDKVLTKLLEKYPPRKK